MGHAGIRNSRHNIRLYGIPVPPGQHASTFITHLFYIDPFVGRGGISIVDPQEGADLHLLPRPCQRLHPFRRDKRDLCGAKFLVILVSQIDICKAFERYTVGSLFVPDHQRSPPVPVSGSVKPVLGHQKHCHGPVHDLLDILDPFHDGRLLADQGSHQLRGVDLAAAHLLEMRMAVPVYLS